MGVRWDTCEVTIKNETAYPMTRTSFEATAGNYDPKPPASVPSKGSGTFKIESPEDNTWSGCGGEAVYTFTDGSFVTLKFFTSYYYGPGNNSQYGTGMGGARGSRFTVAEELKEESSHGGAGKAVKWGLTITYA